MVLVDYPDSDEEVAGPCSPSKPPALERSQHVKNQLFALPRKRNHEDHAETRQRQMPISPPLPSAFHSLYATNVRASTSDDPSLHEGRTRQMPHVEGNWPTHVFLEWYPSRTESETLENVLSKVQTKTTTQTACSQKLKIHSLLKSELGVHLPLHISLSAPLMLRTEQREVFMEELQDAVEDSGVRPFSLQVSGVEWVSNSEKSRWFLVLRLKRPANDGLNLLLAIINGIAKNSGLGMLYADEESNQAKIPEREYCQGSSPMRTEFRGGKQRRLAGTVPADYTSKFHFSIAWQLGDPGGRTSEITDTTESVELLSVSSDCLKVKIGNAVHDIPLPERTSSRQGLGGM